MANYALEIMQPRAGLTTANRFYKAYPGLEYNVRLAVIGGDYPYSFSLTTAPSGMTINTDTGMITWSNPTTSGSPHTVTARVTDLGASAGGMGAGGSVQTVTWTVTVTTSGFIFLDAVNGHASVANGGTGTGTLANPFQTERDWYGTTKAASLYPGYSVYYRAGTYQSNGSTEPTENGLRMPLHTGTKPVVHLAYPGDTMPVLNMNTACWFFGDGGVNNIYLDGLDISTMTAGYGVQVSSDATHVTFRRNHFHGTPATGGANNQAAIRQLDSGSAGLYWSIQDNTFNDMQAYVVVGYRQDRTLVEDNLIYDMVSIFPTIGPKESSNMWFVRHNNVSEVGNAAFWLGLYNGLANANVEVSYNRLKAPSGADAIYINHNGQSNWTNVYVFRNTVEGPFIVNVLASTTGPLNAYNNVIINEDSGFSSTDRISYINSTDLTKLVRANNLSGAAASNIVDANGLLQGSYRTTYLGTRGWELSGTDTTAPAAPSGVTIT